MRQEGANGTRNRDFEEQLRLGSERTSNGRYRRAIRLETVKRAVGISSGLRKIRNWTLWRGRTPPKRKSTSSVSVRRVGNVGAPATRDSYSLPLGRKREKNEENLWMMVITRTNWNFIREPLGTSSLKEGAM
jgi:hypothetical protein